MDKIKLVHFLSRFDIGGMENGITNICNRINRDRFEPVVCCLKGAGSMVSRLKPDVKVINLSYPDGKAPFRPFKLSRYFKKERPAIVHTHGWGGCSLDGILGARISGVPGIINGEHGSIFLKPYQLFLQKEAIHRGN